MAAIEQLHSIRLRSWGRSYPPYSSHMRKKKTTMILVCAQICCLLLGQTCLYGNFKSLLYFVWFHFHNSCEWSNKGLWNKLLRPCCLSCQIKQLQVWIINQTWGYDTWVINQLSARILLGKHQLEVFTAGTDRAQRAPYQKKHQRTHSPGSVLKVKY